MIEIVTKVYGKNKPWTQGITYMGDCLSSYGWSKQATTDTHPNRENLQSDKFQSRFKNTTGYNAALSLFPDCAFLGRLCVVRSHAADHSFKAA